MSASDFYPRPPRGGRRKKWGVTPIDIRISIHALREEGDAAFPSSLNFCFMISIHALREEGDLYMVTLMCNTKEISIHALREEGDLLTDIQVRNDDLFLSTPSARRATQCLTTLGQIKFNFYPRPPRGGRQTFVGAEKLWELFLSTPSARRATLIMDYTSYPTKEFLSTPSARRAT